MCIRDRNWIGRAEDDYHALARYLPDSRWMCTGKTAVGRAKNWPDNIFLYQYEWQNPIPEKNIIEIKLRRTTALADYALLAPVSYTHLAGEFLVWIEGGR